MNESKTPWAIFQIGLGIICLLIGISGFVLAKSSLLSIESLFLGAGLLFIGLSDNNQDKTEKGKMFNAVGNVLFMIGVGFLFYNTFFQTK